MSDRWISSLIEMGAVFTDGRVTGFASDSIVATKDQTAGICDLSHYALLRVTGVDAVSFLHNQFTNDVLQLDEAQSQLNGWCSPKGRLLAAFSLWRSGNAYYLLLPKSISGAIQKRLGMFVLRSKVVIEDVSASHVCFGIVAGGPEEWPAPLNQSLPSVGRLTQTAQGIVVRTSSSRAVLVVAPDNAADAWQRLATTAQRRGANAWDLAAINDGVIEVTADTQDSFVPQMANYELVGGVSFKKGCYPGQEIVARTQYRGILKRRMAKVAISASTPIKAGTSVYSPSFPEQAVGTVATSAMSSDIECVALVVAQLEAIDADSLFLDSTFLPESKLSVQLLPYRYPAA